MSCRSRFESFQAAIDNDHVHENPIDEDQPRLRLDAGGNMDSGVASGRGVETEASRKIANRFGPALTMVIKSLPRHVAVG